MKILCVTKCPTGMVQTYVAAEKLEQAGKKLGIDLSVETQGAMGKFKISFPLNRSMKLIIL